MRTSKRINKWRKFAKTVFIFLFIFTLLIAVYVSTTIIKSVFPLKHIVFTGNKHLTDEELKALAGIHEKTLLTVSNREVARRLLNSPWVRSVSVRKEIPDMLSVAIEEAMPFALLNMNSRLFLIDEKGKLLEELKGDSIPFLPIITGDPFKEVEGFSEALSLARVLNDKGFSSERNHIEIILRRPKDLIVTIDGTVVKIGSGDYEDKLERLIELEDEIKKRQIPVDYIDLRFANRVVVKPIAEVIK